MATSNWNDRYATEDYIFGTNPSQFIENNVNQLKPKSKVLVPADGEGRNSCFIASLGHEVYANDFSENAVQKAQKLADEKGVNAHFSISNINEWEPVENEYDAVVAIFIQFLNSEHRHIVFEKFKKALKPDGILLLHGYTPKQLKFKTGGPSDIDNLYTKQQLFHDFADFDIIKLEEYEKELDEGAGHKGMSGLIDLVARKEI